MHLTSIRKAILRMPCSLISIVKQRLFQGLNTNLITDPSLKSIKGRPIEETTDEKKIITREQENT